MTIEPVRQFVVDALKERGASLFVPLVGADDVDLAVRVEDGQYVELLIRAPSEGKARSFHMGRFRPRPQLFIVGVTADQEAWVLPSGAFDRYASGGPGAPSRELDLDADDGGEPLSERLAVYRGRWALIANFRKFRSTLNDPVALQVQIALS